MNGFGSCQPIVHCGRAQGQLKLAAGAAAATAAAGGGSGGRRNAATATSNKPHTFLFDVMRLPA